MQKLSVRHQLYIGTVLIALLAITRGYHFVSLKHLLPSASWAVFFIAGVYLRPAWTLAGLLGLAALLDYAAITWGGVSAFCVSPAYVALIPAYAALWFAGRWYATRHTLTAATLFPLAASVLAGATVCEVISSGAFYFYSGRFATPNLTEFIGRELKYFPAYLAPMAFWVGISASVQAVVGRHQSVGDSAKLS
jgi:hypothetical protein